MLTLESSIFQLFQAILFTIISLSIKYEPKNRIPRFFRFWFCTYYFHLFINNQKIDKFSYIFLSQLLVWCFFKSQKFGSAKCFVGQDVFYIWISHIWVSCVNCLYICFDKKRQIFFYFQNPFRSGGVLWRYTMDKY